MQGSKEHADWSIFAYIPLKFHDMRSLAMLVFFNLSVLLSYSQMLDGDTLTGRVAVWNDLPLSSGQGVMNRQVLKGATRDLSLLDIRAVTLEAGVILPAYGSDADELIIVREGKLDVSFGDVDKVLGPGGVALFSAGEKYSIEDGDSIPASYYILRFRSRSVKDPSHAGSPFLLDWKEMVTKTTNKGESRQICSRPAAWLGKIDLHATTLNTGEVSHPPHVHRSEELILMRSGKVQEYIGGKYYPATAGDVIYLPSQVPHALENKGNGRCEYFALQWAL
jgi:(S)-ureidoglycine aminohydrolase